MKRIVPCLLLAVLTSSPAFAGDLACTDHGDEAGAASIRAQRETFNQAIVDGDARGVEAALAEDVILVTGTDSDLFEGREAQVAIWQDDFLLDDRAIYVRTTQCVRVSEVFPVALELGAWRGERIDDAESVASGSYSAKWRKVEGQWLLEAEIFSTEACSGSFCD